jgi:hypothetical protein
MNADPESATLYYKAVLRIHEILAVDPDPRIHASD